MGSAFSYQTSVCAPFHLHITLISPIRTPRVLNIPKIDFPFSSVPNDQHGMIHLLRTISTVSIYINPTAVVLKPLSHDKINSNRSFAGDPFRYLLLISLIYVETSIRDLEFDIPSGKTAFLSFFTCWVSICSLYPSYLLQILEDSRRMSSYLTKVSKRLRAVDQLLL